MVVKREVTSARVRAWIQERSLYIVTVFVARASGTNNETRIDKSLYL